MYLTVNLIYFCNSLGCSFFFFFSAKMTSCCFLMRILVKHRVALAGQILGLTPQHFLFFFPFWKLIGLRPGKQLESRGTRRERFIDAWRAHIISSYFGVSKSPLVFESILIIKRKYCLLKKLHLHFKVKLKKKKSTWVYGARVHYIHMPSFFSCFSSLPPSIPLFPFLSIFLFFFFCRKSLFLHIIK